MTYLANQDFLIEVAKGNIAGHSIVHKFGRYDANDKWQRATKRFIDSANSASKAFKESQKQFTHENTKSD